ncbi:MAG TPA: hypothetical protein IAB56_05700 [Candidatus Scybalousia intestinigallinarum]|nr:hypothetical protein [Candidatus Scybalousia intestinigallinarum]
MKKRKAKSKKQNIKKQMLIAGSLLVIVVLAVAVIYFSIENNKFNKDITLTFNDRTQDSLEFKHEDFYTVGWIQVQGTNIDMPVINGFDYGDDGISDYAWRSSEYDTDETREVISGHNIINVSSTPIRDMSMLNYFEGLMAFTYYDFAQDNLYISYTKEGKEELYKIYAIGFYDYAGNNDRSMSNPEQIKEYIASVRNNSIYDYDIEVDENDELITIKTCTRYFGAFEKQLFVIDARKVRDNEEIEKYKVKKSKNFDMLSEGVTTENG